MYERWSCEQTEAQSGGTPNSQAVLSTFRVPESSPIFYYKPDDPEEQNYILYVHGWNMAPVDKATHLRKRHSSGFGGKAIEVALVHFQWPVTYHNVDVASIIDYDDGEYTAWNSALALKGLPLAPEG